VSYTPDKLTRLVRDALKGLAAEGAKPTVSIAKDPWNVIEILTDAPRGGAVIGEAARTGSGATLV